ncbi:hypothetical protein H8E88_04140 [candidate division KSB1 bacterium]|nr:hypothetical protein [candidate division KSB1 bacterium]MBL7093142.1 hypothetical protein [candidate division KSB1 bacterium]
MDLNILIGIIIVFLAYIFLLYLVLWSRKTIEHISDLKVNSLRDIIRELRHGR